MQELFFGSLIESLSRPRIEAYAFGLRPRAVFPENNVFSKLLRYAWNVRLCEALYPSLQKLEVALRNAVHNELATARSPTWYAEPGILNSEGSRAVQEVVGKLKRNKKPVSPENIVADLSFGFWTSLFNVEYERTLYVPHLSRIFRRARGPFRKRKILSKRLNDIRLLRNRVFHHEPIWNRPRLLQAHNSILETIFWLNPDLHALVAEIDRFPAVHAAGSAPFGRRFFGLLSRCRPFGAELLARAAPRA